MADGDATPKRKPPQLDLFAGAPTVPADAAPLTGVPAEASGDGLTDQQRRKREYMRKYRKKPEAKQRKREYEQRPEVKQRNREYERKYWQKPEAKQRRREHDRKYRQKPEVKQRRRERDRKHKQKPEAKQRKREYREKPEVKQREREYRENPEVKQRERERIIKSYGVTVDAYWDMRTKHRCLCGGTFCQCSIFSGKELLCRECGLLNPHQDHVPGTNNPKVMRGLLCAECNKDLGVKEARGTIHMVPAYVDYLANPPAYAYHNHRPPTPSPAPSRPAVSPTPPQSAAQTASCPPSGPASEPDPDPPHE